MWLVRIALRRPYTFVVMALLIVILGVLTIARMPTDIFPDIDIPVVSIVFNYGGLAPEEMEKRIVTNFERTVTTVVNDIEHVESLSLTGIGVIKLFLQPGASAEGVTAQATAAAQTAIRQMPPGTTPPLILRYSASNVPILQLALESDSLSEQQLFDYGTNFVRNDLATVQGAQLPWPYGGKQRQIMVDLDLSKLYGWGLSPREVNDAVGVQNVILPTGTAKIGVDEYPIVMNASPELLTEIGGIPIKTVRGAPVYIRDVANVRDGYAPQTSLVHVEGKKSVLMSVLKQGSASTLDVVKRIRDILPSTLSRLPKTLKVALLFDQSVFVRAAVQGVVKEAAIAAGLTALMLLLFLGSWRSTIIVLNLLGQTLNVMTLGGMSLAVGILVDDATVEIENVHRNLAKKKPIVRAILDGASEIAVPAFVSTLCICIVFVPVAFITGSAKSLFIPLAMAVVFAMLTSYFLSRTLVPTMMRYLMTQEAEHHSHDAHAAPRSLAGRFLAAFEARFAQLRQVYGSFLAWALAHKAATVAAFVAFVGVSLALLPFIGRDFFPSVDAGLIKLHARGPPGTRIEESERRFAATEDAIRKVIPPAEIDTMLDNIGVPYSSINLSLSEGVLVSPADGDILISLKPEHKPTAGYVRVLRETFARQFPDTTYFFLAPDISTQVLNFGLPAPIDIQVVGPIGAEDATQTVAARLMGRIAGIPGAVDVHLGQTSRIPELRIDVDRTMAQAFGMSERDVASDMLVSLSSSALVSPSFWLDKRGVQYLLAVQTPQFQVDSLDALKATPLSNLGSQPQFLSNVASVSRTFGAASITHYNVARTYDVQANVDGTDLGSVADGVYRVVDEMKGEMPRGTTARVKGQIESMQSSFRGLAYGLLFAVVLVYFLMVINFQSWLDPLVILMALPGAMAGIAWMLFLSHTTVSVPALMGSIMCVGVATANSILVVTFANGQRHGGHDATMAALTAGMTRLRPVIMTALAMILGMLPMSLGLGEGGEQNAPLGRAVIGGLLVATLTTLLFVPVMYVVLRKKQPVVDPELEHA
jgi:multidrug efflux pump subunit AcrB